MIAIQSASHFSHNISQIVDRDRQLGHQRDGRRATVTVISDRRDTVVDSHHLIYVVRLDGDIGVDHPRLLHYLSDLAQLAAAMLVIKLDEHQRSG